MESAIEKLRKENPYIRTFEDKVRINAEKLQYAIYDTKCEIQKQFPRSQSRVELLTKIENIINFNGETSKVTIASDLTPETDNICKICGGSEYYGTANFITIRGGNVCDDCI